MAPTSTRTMKKPSRDSKLGIRKNKRAPRSSPEIARRSVRLKRSTTAKKSQTFSTASGGSPRRKIKPESASDAESTPRIHLSRRTGPLNLAKLSDPLPISVYHHINREVLNLKESKTFYSCVLGLKEIPRPTFPRPGVWLQGRGLNLHLTQTLKKDAKTREELLQRRKEHFLSRIPNVDHFAFLSDHLDEIEAILVEQSVCFRKVTVPLTGAVQLFIFDPDCNLIEISSCQPEAGQLKCTPKHGQH